MNTLSMVTTHRSYDKTQPQIIPIIDLLKLREPIISASILLVRAAEAITKEQLIVEINGAIMFLEEAKKMMAATKDDSVNVNVATSDKPQDWIKNNPEAFTNSGIDKTVDIVNTMSNL